MIWAYRGVIVAVLLAAYTLLVVLLEARRIRLTTQVLWLMIGMLVLATCLEGMS